MCTKSKKVIEIKYEIKPLTNTNKNPQEFSKDKSHEKGSPSFK